MMAKEECSRIGESLPEYLAGRVSASEEARIRAHLEACPECRGRANAVSLLQQTPVPSPDPDRWNFFVKGVVSEAERRRRLVTPRRVWVLAAALIVAAALIFTCSRVAAAQTGPEPDVAQVGEVCVTVGFLGQPAAELELISSQRRDLEGGRRAGGR